MGDDDKDYTITIGSSEDIGGWESTTINGLSYSFDTTASPQTITLDSLDVNDTGSEFTYNMGSTADKIIVDTMPSIARLDEMCKMYPDLAKAYEQFKLIYKMTEQDFKGKLKERGIDDEIPF